MGWNLSPTGGGEMKFESFCAAVAAQKLSIKTNPPQDWGGLGGVENLIANRNQSDQDTRGGPPRPPAFGTAPETWPLSSKVGYNSLRDHSIFLFPQK